MSEAGGTLVVRPTNPYRLPSYIAEPLVEYAALRDGAIAIDRRARGRMKLAGDKAREVLTGLVTNDALALQPGQGMYAAALTPKGKIISDLRVYAREGELWIDTPPLAWAGWWEIVRKYINPRLARYADLTESFGCVGVYGAAATTKVAQAMEIPTGVLEGLAVYAHHAIETNDGPALVARVPDAGVDGVELWIPSASFDASWQRVVAAKVAPVGAATADLMRIEAGRPEWGIDMDETTLVQEANLDELHAVSYTKGCYTGQETVARVHFRGHVNRHLRGVLLTGDVAPAFGTDLVAGDGRTVGDVRSAARSPRLGIIALAMIRREVPAGETVRLAGADTEGRVVELPFA